jgi:hypothetical protein
MSFGGIGIGRGGRDGYSVASGGGYFQKPTRAVPASYVPSNDGRINRLADRILSSRRQAETNDSRMLGALGGGLLGGFGGSLTMYICATTAVFLPAALVVGVPLGYYFNAQRQDDFKKLEPDCLRRITYIIEEKLKKDSDSLDDELIRCVTKEWSHFDTIYIEYQPYDPD